MSTSLIFIISASLTMLIRNMQISIDLPYMQILGLLEVVVFLILAVVFLFPNCLISVVQALIEWIEYFYVGVRGDILHTIYVVLLFDGFLNFNRFIAEYGVSNTAQFLAHPPLSFQLGCLLFCLESSVALVTFLLCWKYRSIIGHHIDAQRLKALGLNPSPQQLKNLAYLAVMAAAGAVTASAIGSVSEMWMGSQALEINHTMAENLQKDLVDKRITSDEYIQGIKSVAESNAEIGKKSASNFALKN